MLEKIKESLIEVQAIADTCQEKYQVKCFEILLNALLTSEGMISVAPGNVTPGVGGKKSYSEFFNRNNITEDEWQRVYHFDGETYSIIVSNLKEKQVSKKQVKLALLLGIKTLLETGDSIIEKGQFIDLCKQHASYDSANFSAIMKKQRLLFLSKGRDWTLTKPGESQAADVIKELAQ